MTEHYIQPDPDHEPPLRWVYIERASEGTDPDMYVGPFLTSEDAALCMDESLLIEGELQPPRGGLDCYVTIEQPDLARDEVVLINHNDPDHTGKPDTRPDDGAAIGIMSGGLTPPGQTLCEHCGTVLHRTSPLWLDFKDEWVCPTNDSNGGDAAPHQPKDES